MKVIIAFSLLFAAAAFPYALNSSQDEIEPWTEKQLMDPAELARIINDPHSQKPVIFSIGPIELIKSSVDIGQVKEKKNLEKFRQQLYNLSRDKNIVIYCGCCPFADCPNIRPAFMLLNEMKFTNHKLLFLPHNLKIDWMNNGFPINE